MSANLDTLEPLCLFVLPANYVGMAPPDGLGGSRDKAVDPLAWYAIA